MVINFSFQPMDQLLDLMSQPGHALAADHFGVQDCGDPLNSSLELIVDDDVLVLLDGSQLLESGI